MLSSLLKVTGGGVALITASNPMSQLSRFREMSAPECAYELSSPLLRAVRIFLMSAPQFNDRPSRESCVGFRGDVRSGVPIGAAV